MKRILYRIMACCAAALFCAACSSEEDMPARTETAGNSIVIDISSGALPVSRATVEATGAEIAVSHIDVLVFETDGDNAKAYHERVQVNNSGGNKTGTITLAKGSDEFAQGKNYWIYLVANSAHESTVFSNLTNLSELKQMTEETPNIHMTGLEGENLPQTFLMDGVAYEGNTEPSAPAAITLNPGGDQTADRVLRVTMRRAAAKIVIRITAGEKVEFLRQAESEKPAYYVRNMPYTTSVIAGVNAPAGLRIPERTGGGYLTWGERQITITAYTYAHQWGTGSDFQNKVRMVVNIPMTYRKDADSEPETKGSNWYQIPVRNKKNGEDKYELKRNTCYVVTATVNALGGVDPSKPIELTDIGYSVADWADEKVSVGGEEDKVQFLYLNEEEMEMHDTDTDETTLRFTSSSGVTATVTGAYYIDKNGEVQNVPDDIFNQISATPAQGLTGGITIHSPNPENNAVRYIQLEVTNEDKITRKVTVRQYPLEYITNIKGWYSYREDFNTSWEMLNGESVSGDTYNTSVRITERWVAATGYRGGKWRYGNDIDETGYFFNSKIARDPANGSTGIYLYSWKENATNQNYTYTRDASETSKYTNARMYHVQITASSGEYTLGKPRLDKDGYTDGGTDNAKLVSPSFMIASQLGETIAVNDFVAAKEHCREYVEVYKDAMGKTVYLKDWRLPTRAEIEIIIKFQYNPDAAIDEVLPSRGYWCADGENVDNPGGEGSDNFLRCIRDAYDTPAAQP